MALQFGHGTVPSQALKKASPPPTPVVNWLEEVPAAVHGIPLFTLKWRVLPGMVIRRSIEQLPVAELLQPQPDAHATLTPVFTVVFVVE